MSNQPQNNSPVRVLVNARGGALGDPSDLTVSGLLDTVFGNVEGMLIYRDYQGWQALAPSIPGYVLTTNGPGSPISWTSGAAPASPAFTAFGITGVSSPIEVGATIAGGSYTFTWSTSNSANVAANSISIVDTTASTTLASGLANTGSDAITLGSITNNIPATQTWTISGQNTAAGTFTDTFSVAWLWRVYAGTNTAVTLTANQIKALSSSSALQAAFAGTYTITSGSAVYYYISYPDSLGSVANFVDGTTGFPISMATASDNAAYSNTANGWSYALVSVINAQSIATQYRLYRTQYSFSGTLIMIVS